MFVGMYVLNFPNSNYFHFSLVGVVKSVLTTVIGFFTFGGVPVTTLTVLGVTLNSMGGVLYSYAKYVEKKSKLDAIKSIILPQTVQDVGQDVPKQQPQQQQQDVPQNEQQQHKPDNAVALGIDDRTHA